LDGYRPADLDKLYHTLEPFEGQYELNFFPAYDCRFIGYKGLHGNKIPYMKLILPDFIDAERVIYLDSDLIVTRDLKELFCLDLRSHAIAVSGVATIDWAIEKQFFTSLGLKTEALYFNTGVMLIDLRQWRKWAITERCLEFANKYPNQLSTADQTVLNYVFYENKFLVLDQGYNHVLYPGSHSVAPDSVGEIFHFVGSPKPWDFLGEIFHTNYHLFHSVLCHTAFHNYKSYRDLNFLRVKRTLRLSRAYYHLVRRRGRD
jgi:lipopolysaccharide biosynthesis glycosyltransferase